MVVTELDTLFPYQTIIHLYLKCNLVPRPFPLPVIDHLNTVGDLVTCDDVR